MAATDPRSSWNDSTTPAATAPGVTYTTIDEMPGLRFFDCQPYRARLTTKSCADRWRMAQKATGNAAASFEKCQRCPIGASHAGQVVTYYSPLYGKAICSRCGRGSMRRMILAGRLCIGCYNRELEFRRGRNAKGNPPKIRLDRRTARYWVEGSGVQ